MSTSEPGENGLVVDGQKIGENEDHRSAAQRGLEGGERVPQACPRAGGRAREQIADDSEGVTSSLGGLDVQLDAIGEEDRADSVIIAGGGERKHGADFGGQLSLGATDRSEFSGRAPVHHEHHRQLPLFEIALYVRGAEPGGDIPVDGPHVITRLVLPHLGELHATSPERARVFSRHDVPHEVARGDLDSPHLARDFVGGHGTGTASKIRPSSASGPTPSASAR